MLALLFAGSALLGLVAAAAVAGSIEAAACGAAVGSHLVFAAFGARTFAGCGAEHGSALAIGFLPLPWALVGGLAVEATRRFAWRRLPDDRVRRVAYAGKLALCFGVALGITAGLVASGDPARRGSSFASSLNGGEVWFYASTLTWFWAWLGLRRHGLRVLPSARGTLGEVKALGRRAGEGAAAFAGLAVGLAVLGLVFALVVADSGHGRIGLVFAFPVAGFSFGAALADGAMGAALGGVFGHTSLTHFALPAGPAAGAAPTWLFATVLLAPGAVAASVWRRLERERPAKEQSALAVGAAIGVGFAVAAWAAALVGRIVVLATIAVEGPLRDRFSGGETVGTLVAARPNPAAVLGLGLFWGLAGGLGTAFFWASRHNARWQIAGPPATGGTADSPPPPAQSAWLLPETPPTPVPPPEPPAPAVEPPGEKP
jgi:hypothetical protein